MSDCWTNDFNKKHTIKASTISLQNEGIHVFTSLLRNMNNNIVEKIILAISMSNSAKLIELLNLEVVSLTI